MFTLPETRFYFAGDEYIYAEISRDMSAESNFKALVITNDLRNRNIPGITEICSGNASYLVRFNPDILGAHDLLDYLRDIDINKSQSSNLELKIRIVEIPTWYNDPVTQEYSRRFSSKHQAPGLTNFEYVMKVNGYTDESAFIEAHSSMPHLITMIGFTPGLSWTFPLGVAQEKVINTPKYMSPRTDTPPQAVAIGGAFTVVYTVHGPGSYQLIGMSAVPAYQLKPKFPELMDTMILARPGDIWKYRPIDEREFSQISHEVENGTYQYHSKEVEFSVGTYLSNGRQYILPMMEDF